MARARTAKRIYAAWKSDRRPALTSLQDVSMCTSSSGPPRHETSVPPLRFDGPQRDGSWSRTSAASMSIYVCYVNNPGVTNQGRRRAWSRGGKVAKAGVGARKSMATYSL